jgi:hypothetical protein
MIQGSYIYKTILAKVLEASLEKETRNQYMDMSKDAHIKTWQWRFEIER